jgi:hypothetical protein
LCYFRAAQPILVLLKKSNAAIELQFQLLVLIYYADFTWQRSSTYNAINSDILEMPATLCSIANCRSQRKADGDIVTVTGVLTVSDQFAGAIFKTVQLLF